VARGGFQSLGMLQQNRIRWEFYSYVSTVIVFSELAEATKSGI